jgi:hypothetical protein
LSTAWQAMQAFFLAKSLFAIAGIEAKQAVIKVALSAVLRVIFSLMS